MRVIGWFQPYGCPDVYAVVQMWIDGQHQTTNPEEARSIVVWDNGITGVGDPDDGVLGRLH